MITTAYLQAETDVRSYLTNFRDADKFLGFCRQCRNYGLRYGCPPLDYDVPEKLARYSRIRITGVKIIPQEKGIPLSAADALMAPVVLQMNRELLEQEKQLQGYACGFVGTCPYCDTPCARRDGQPCRHPDLVRPSLEALGFDVSKTAELLLGEKILWSHDNLLPDYLLLVCGLFF